jgi:N-acetylglucosamine malate deacetylase 1
MTRTRSSGAGLFGASSAAERRALVVAAHPDDEVLGCGGTMALLAHAGWQVQVLILGEGATSRTSVRDRAGAQEHLSKLALAARSAAVILGARVPALRDFPDNRMDTVALLDIVKAVEAAIDEFSPRVVFTHHAGDVNIDHRRIHEAVVAACRPVPGQVVRRLYYFEVASSTEWQTAGSAPAFTPQVFVDIGATLAKKLKALDAYEAEMREFPHPRSNRAVEALARWRGATAGCEAAEAFMCGWELVSG